MFHKPRFLEQAALAVVLIAFSFTGVAQSKTKAYTADELAMMSNADSVKLFRLETMAEQPIYPTALPDRMIEEESISRLSEEIPFPDINESFADNGNRMDYDHSSNRSITVEELKRLLEFLSGSEKAESEVKSGCTFDPGAGIKFYNGNERFYVLLCFNCNIWAFERREAMYYVAFDPDKRKELVKFAKDLFPNDPAFQSIKD